MNIRNRLLAGALGAGSALGYAPFGIFPLPWLTLGALAWLCRQAPSPRAAAWLGFFWGFGFFLAGVSWVFVSLRDVGGMALPLALAATVSFCAYLALFPALAGYAFRRLLTAKPLGDAALFAACWTVAEWLRGTLFTGFPWLSLGHSQTPPSPLAGYAPVLGSYGVSLLAAWAAALAALGWRQRATWVATVLVLVGGALLRGMEWTRPVGSPVATALLQGNVPQELKWRPERLTLSLETYTTLARAHPAELTILPETAIPLFFDGIPAEILAALAGQGELLLGAVVRHRDGGYVNGAVAIARDGSRQVYAKRHLVPFGEYAPPGFSWFFRWVDIPLTDFSAGPAVQAPLSLAGQQLALTICYEDLFGEEILSFLPQATLLVNLSNTAWFGDSLAQPQHLQILRMRALESGRMALAATNTGITAAIAPDGRVIAALPPFSRGALRVAAQGYAGATPYMYWGNGLTLFLAALMIMAALGARRRRSRMDGEASAKGA